MLLCITDMAGPGRGRLKKKIDVTKTPKKTMPLSDIVDGTTAGIGLERRTIAPKSAVLVAQRRVCFSLQQALSSIQIRDEPEKAPSGIQIRDEEESDDFNPTPPEIQKKCPTKKVAEK